MRRPRYLMVSLLPVRSERPTQEFGLKPATLECGRAVDCRILLGATPAQQFFLDASPQRTPRPALRDSDREKSKGRSKSVRSEDPREDTGSGPESTDPNQTETRRGLRRPALKRLLVLLTAVGVGLH